MNRRLLAMMTLAIISLSTLSCEPGFYEYNVRNNSKVPVGLGFEPGDCWEPRPTRSGWEMIQPGTSLKKEPFRWSHDGFGCMYLTDSSGLIVFRDSLSHGGFYSVRGDTRLEVNRIGDGDQYNLNYLFAFIVLTVFYLLLALLVFAAISAVLVSPVALFFAARYLYRYYVSKRRQPPA